MQARMMILNPFRYVFQVQRMFMALGCRFLLLVVVMLAGFKLI